MSMPNRETEGRGESVNSGVNVSSTRGLYRNSGRTLPGDYSPEELAQYDVLRQYPGLTDALLDLLESSRVMANALKALCMRGGELTTSQFASFGGTTAGTARVYTMRLRDYGVLETTRGKEAYHTFASDDVEVLVRFLLELVFSEWAATFDPTRALDRPFFDGDGRLSPQAVQAIDAETRIDRDVTRYGARGPPGPMNT